MKRTMLDMEGVFSSASDWVEKVTVRGDDPLISEKTAQQLLQDEPVAISRVSSALDVDDMAAAAGLKPEEIEQIVTGKPVTRLSSKSLADSVVFNLSDDDRDMLEKINSNHSPRNL